MQEAALQQVQRRPQQLLACRQRALLQLVQAAQPRPLPAMCQLLRQAQQPGLHPEALPGINGAAQQAAVLFFSAPNWL
jgi:hypothetical protein